MSLQNTSKTIPFKSHFSKSEQAFLDSSGSVNHSEKLELEHGDGGARV